MSISENGAYLYLHEKKLFYFIYMKATKEQVEWFLGHKASINNSIYKPYICIFFDSGGHDYLGNLNENEIQELIQHLTKSCNMKNILENNYETLKKCFPSLTEMDFEEKVAFSKKQFASFE